MLVEKSVPSAVV